MGIAFSRADSYHGDGNRIKKLENGVSTVYVNRYYEKNLTVSEETKHYLLGGKEVAFKKGMSLYYLLTDHLGSTSVITDANGVHMDGASYVPFGARRQSDVTLTDKLFTGQRSDGTGLEFYNARYYDAGLGRFLSADEIIPNPTDPQAYNRYAYVLNRPTVYIDESGHCPICIPLLILAVKVGFAAYDAYTTYKTFKDPNASNLDKALAAGNVAQDLLEAPGVKNAIKSSVSNLAKEGAKEWGHDLKKNLLKLTSKTEKEISQKGLEAHHVLPVKFKKQFEEAGIKNIR